MNSSPAPALRLFPLLDPNVAVVHLANILLQHERARFVRQRLFPAGETVLRRGQELARTITLEMGKLFRASVEEIEKCARACRFYAENGERLLEDEAAQTDAARSYVQYEPLGPILAIMPEQAASAGDARDRLADLAAMRGCMTVDRRSTRCLHSPLAGSVSGEYPPRAASSPATTALAGCADTRPPSPDPLRLVFMLQASPSCRLRGRQAP